MKVKTLMDHANDHGAKRPKVYGDIYEHPQPGTLLATGYVTPVDAKVRTARLKKDEML